MSPIGKDVKLRKFSVTVEMLIVSTILLGKLELTCKVSECTC